MLVERDSKWAGAGPASSGERGRSICQTGGPSRAVVDRTRPCPDRLDRLIGAGFEGVSINSKSIEIETCVQRAAAAAPARLLFGSKIEERAEGCIGCMLTCGRTLMSKPERPPTSDPRRDWGRPLPKGVPSSTKEVMGVTVNSRSLVLQPGNVALFDSYVFPIPKSPSNHRARPLVPKVVCAQGLRAAAAVDATKNQPVPDANADTTLGSIDSSSHEPATAPAPGPDGCHARARV